MTDTIAYFANYYGITPQEVIQASQWFDSSIDDSVEDLLELIRDHNEITTTAAITELLQHV